MQAAYGTGPLDGGGTVLDGSMLRDLTELRGALGAELRGMRRDAMAAWLSGTREDMRDEMSIAVTLTLTLTLTLTNTLTLTLTLTL